MSAQSSVLIWMYLIHYIRFPVQFMQFIISSSPLGTIHIFFTVHMDKMARPRLSVNYNVLHSIGFLVQFIICSSTPGVIFFKIPENIARFSSVLHFILSAESIMPGIFKENYTMRNWKLQNRVVGELLCVMYWSITVAETFGWIFKLGPRWMDFHIFKIQGAAVRPWRSII